MNNYEKKRRIEGRGWWVKIETTGFPQVRFIGCANRVPSLGDLAIRLFFKCFWCTNPFSHNSRVREGCEKGRKSGRANVYHELSLRERPEATIVAYQNVSVAQVRPGSEPNVRRRPGMTKCNFSDQGQRSKGRILRPRGPIFLGISPGRSPAAPV